MKAPIYVILFLLVTIGFLSQTIYYLWIISLEGGIAIVEPNIIIAMIELSLACASFIILGIFTVQSILEEAHEKLS